MSVLAVLCSGPKVIDLIIMTYYQNLCEVFSVFSFVISTSREHVFRAREHNTRPIYPTAHNPGSSLSTLGGHDLVKMVDDADNNDREAGCCYKSKTKQVLRIFKS